MKTKYNGTREEDNIAELGDEFFKKARRIGRPVSEHPKKRMSIIRVVFSVLLERIKIMTIFSAR